ncbi:MAG: hypothetical protein H6819_01510 [Phycisphaerales bacterium]|nr:hypothetical protein [Phycisphaerales bacterium]MCB9857114.1 hypothetical protein [Phycisphaerales bacterium]MCB9861759.1 hypothetical protein [Phycisphaerales bacterium]
MYRLLASCLALCLMMVITGCKASPESEDATTRLGGMMPAGETTPEILYAVDQSEVKVLPERTVSKEPLSTFRDKLEEKRAAETAMPTTMAGAGDEASTAAAAAPEEKSLWGSVRSLLGGKKAEKAVDAPKPSDDSDTTKTDDENDESADKKDDAGDDEDW